jgi:hypothetical protein
MNHAFSKMSIQQYDTMPRYNWNIVGSGVKHHIPKPNFFIASSVLSNVYLMHYLAKLIEIY